jgi:hypothetical protein
MPELSAEVVSEVLYSNTMTTQRSFFVWILKGSRSQLELRRH